MESSFFKAKPSKSNQNKLDAHSFLPWVEKYRPKTVDDVAYQEEVVSTLKKSIESKNLPHLLFYGPPGTGKTSTILAIGKQLYGDLFKQRVMELNASDERGINVVRTKIKNFAQVAISASSSTQAPPYKLIILDEADSMTADAQTALRRTMETYSKTTRFCLICNYVSRIIEPLASRCAKFRFKPLNSDSMHNRIKFICEQERVPYSQKLAETLSDVSSGDLRRAITLLQSAFSFYKQELTPECLIEVAGRVPSSTIEQLMKAANSNSFDQLKNVVSDTIASGYPVAQILSQLFDVIADSTHLNDAQKSKIAEQLAVADKCLQDGADEFLQLMNVLSFTMHQICA